MFWGLIMEPNKRYSQTVENSFHVSTATLDLTTADDKVIQVMLCYGGRNYLLCNLQKNTTSQVSLNLNFQEGTEIAFTCNGQGHVHLTGYLILDEDMDMDELEEQEMEQKEKIYLSEKQSKRKAIEPLKDKKEAKRVKQEAAESSDDLEMAGIDEDDTEDSDSAQEEEEEEDSNDEDEEEDDDDDDDNNKKQQVRNPHEKRGKQTQEQQQRQKKKQDKQKLVNGKEVRQEQQDKQRKNKIEQQSHSQQNIQSETKKRVIEGGVQIKDLKVGNGTPAKSGKFISVYYVGRLKNGKRFDATTQGDGFKFRLGKAEVIKGWDVGIIGMKVGGKRRITIPANMAYGVKGSPPAIPGNSTLIFEVELRNVH